jgi:hypothetical protein
MYRFLTPLLCSLFLTSCPRKECRVNGGEYDFELSASLSPAQSTYRVGDTISIESVFPSELFDIVTEQLFTLENFRFYPEFFIDEISTSPIRENGLDYFTVIVDSNYEFSEFRYSSGLVSYIGEYTYRDENYLLNFKIVPKERGFYRLVFGSGLESFGEHQEFPGKCNNVTSNANVKLNEGTDNNIGLLANSPDDKFNTWILEKPFDRFHRFGSFAFVVE